MATIDPDLLAQLPLAQSTKVTFYKRDEITTDLICCDVALGGSVWAFHEELVGKELLIGHLQQLPGFRPNWFAAVAQSPFAPRETVDFNRE